MRKARSTLYVDDAEKTQIIGTIRDLGINDTLKQNEDIFLDI